MSDAIQIIEIVVFHKSSRQILILKRNNPPLVWSTITGGIKNGETPFEAAKRELFEETGNAHAVVYDLHRVYSFLPQHEDALVNCHCFAAEFETQVVNLNAEHGDYQWVDLDRALQIIPYDDQRKNMRNTADALGFL